MRKLTSHPAAAPPALSPSTLPSGSSKEIAGAIPGTSDEEEGDQER
eukprot:CAMPEP_0171247960 /NCGR_PEP_ID=MMETSP0790-20130122/48769_1 /TAXON_ID=2925 /ORGANISM="Alexandrium catenella, Strain OF101" /LENGTH=45 /DNA_ID= /DNA_START= /DNA_END= /DNA_ORIENTATION=